MLRPNEDVWHLTRCMDDFEYYALHHLKIRNLDGNLVAFELNYPQKVVLEKISKQLQDTGRVRAIILKARQEGISTLVAGRFYRRIHLHSLQRGMVIADLTKKSQTLFEMYERFQKHLDDTIRVERENYEQGQKLILQSESQIHVDTAGNREAGRSGTLQLLHASELAFWTGAEQVWTAVAPSIPKQNSEVIIESTANGIGNFFHSQWEKAEAGTSGYIAIFLPWWIYDEYEIPVDEDQRNQILGSDDPFERKALDEGFMWEGSFHKLTVEKLAWRRWVGIPEQCAGDPRKFQQEYPSTSTEAFLVSGSGFFDVDRLQEYAERTKPPVSRGRLVSERGVIKVSPSERGWLRLWEFPDLVCKQAAIDKDCASGKRVKKLDKWLCKNCHAEMVDGLYVIGADTASGRRISMRSLDDADLERGGRDFSCADVFEVHSRRQVAQLHGGMYPEEFAKQLNWLGYLYGSSNGGRRFPALLAVEKNHASGETVIRKLQTELAYPNLYRSKQMNVAFNKVTPVLGWVTTKVTRMPMLDGLGEAVRNQSVAIPSADTIRELYTFVQMEDGKPQAQEGTHDDRVISLAICLQIARTKNHEPTSHDLPDVEVIDSPTGLMDYGWS